MAITHDEKDGLCMCEECCKRVGFMCILCDFTCETRIEAIEHFFREHKMIEYFEEIMKDIN